MDAALIVGVDGDSNRLAMARRMGADVVFDYRETDVVSEVKKLTGGGADVAIEALGTQGTFEGALRLCDRAARSPASASTRASCKSPTTLSPPGLGINGS